MERMQLSDGGGFAAAVAAGAAVLRAGGVVALPTETVYGLATRWGHAPGIARIYELKHRAENKPLQMLAADLAMARAAGVLPDPRLDKLAAAFMPGPLTVVCRAADGGTIGLRIPQHAFTLALLRELGVPLAATSANRSGEPPGADAAGAVAGLAGEPDLLVDGGPIRQAQASTVVSLLEPDLKLLRPGPLTLDALKRALP